VRPIVMEQRLRSEMNVLVPSGLYPAGVVPVPDVRIKGPAFFPGGSGLYLEGGDTATPRTSTFPIGCVMVVGHNFDLPKWLRTIGSAWQGAVDTWEPGECCSRC
jgi:hypothetical protein